MRPAYAALQHSPAPEGDSVPGAVFVDLGGFAVSPDASQFDIDDAAACHLHRLSSIFRVMDRLIEANGGIDFPLENGVINDVIVGEGLLNHHQIEFIQYPEERGVF
jgi:hypothetical protein